jgi:two-component system response regulator PilR (NtrC family)
MPPLRERLEDLPLFIERFLARFAASQGRPRPALSPETERLLRTWGWPGNVRELANVLERAITLTDGDVIGPEVLPEAMRGRASSAAPVAELPEGGMDLQSHLDAIERRILEQALLRSGGVKTEAARMLSLTFRSLRYRLDKFGIG